MDIFANQPIIAVRDHPHLANALHSMRRRGKAWSPLPGVYAHPNVPDTWETRVLAAMAWAPDHALVGAAAVRVTWWDDLSIDDIELWGARKESPVPWLTVRRASLDPDVMIWHDDYKFAAPALSAVQLVKSMGGHAVDEALRRGVATVADMHLALNHVPGHTGNRLVRRILWESRDVPWSELERLAHTMLRRARITGWKANATVQVGGMAFPEDLLFGGSKLIAELDGYEFHKDRATFVRDRVKQNVLTLAGWRVLRFTWETIEDFVPQIRQALSQKR